MEPLSEWKAARQACRSNLHYLCRVLGYNDVTEKVHGRIIANLQKFKGGIDDFQPKQVQNLKENQVALPTAKALRESYKPFIPNFWDLEGNRRTADFIPRGHLKTTVKTFAHTVQWIINYPDVRVMLFTHTDARGKEFLSEIRKHFTHNETFRYLFPEHVPWGKKVNEFGNQEYFDTEARVKWRKEHTVSFLTISSAKSGGHWDVIKADDVEDSSNVITPDMIATVKREFGNVGPLLETHAHPTRGDIDGWFDLTGTFYDFSGLNYSIYEAENEKPAEKRIWSVNVQSAAPNWPDGPYLWPERCGYNKLKQIEEDPAQGPSVLASQYLMNPVPPGTGLIDSEDEIVWTPRKVLKELYARLSLYVAIDLAGMDETARNFNKNDYTAITLGGFGTDGHLYLLECIHGRPTAEKVIEEMFALYRRHPRIIQFKIEKEAHARVLLPFLKSEEGKRNHYLPIMALPRDNQVAKTQKLKGLQPWFKRGMIHIAEDLPCKFHLRNEIIRFPKFKDDILDTIHDLMSTAKGGITAEVMGDGPKDYSVESRRDDLYHEYLEAVEAHTQEHDDIFTTY